MKKEIIVLIVIYLFILSCSQSRKNVKKIDKTEVITMNNLSTNYLTLINNVKINGDTDSYDELFYSFMDSNKAERTDSLMIYSKIMAEKFNYKKAYFDYFKAFCEKNNIYVDYSDYSSIDITKMENISKMEAENWLKKMLKKKIITHEEFNKIKI